MGTILPASGSRKNRDTEYRVATPAGLPAFDDQTEDYFARLVEVLSGAVELGIPAAFELTEPVSSEMLDCIVAAIDAPGLVFLRPREVVAVGSGITVTATVSEVAA